MMDNVEMGLWVLAGVVIAMFIINKVGLGDSLKA